jgi:hypothetical protein
MPGTSAPRLPRWSHWMVSLLLIAAGCAEPRSTSQVPAAVPAGQARIWFYRDWEPSESLNVANVDVNGTSFGAVVNGGAFYRDVPPGYYRIAPVSYNRDFNQDREVNLAPNQQLFVKIVSLRNWDGACRHCARDTFYAWLIPPEVAQAEINRFIGGS